MSTKYESPSLNNLNLERIFRNCFSLSLNGGLVGGNREVLASYPEPSRYQVGTYRRDKSKRTKRWPLWSCYNDRRWRQPCETTTTSVVGYNVGYKRCEGSLVKALWRISINFIRLFFCLRPPKKSPSHCAIDIIQPFKSRYFPTKKYFWIYFWTTPPLK